MEHINHSLLVVGLFDDGYPLLRKLRGPSEHNWQERPKIAFRKGLVCYATLTVMLSTLRREQGLPNNG
jgi:hypothetical protein